MEQYLVNNMSKYNAIKDKAEIIATSSNYGSNLVDVKIIDTDYFNKLPQEQMHKELALIADEGNLCFGYSYQGKIRKDTHRIKVYID